MEKATVHSIVVSSAAASGHPLAQGDVGILEYEGGTPVRLSFTPANGVPLDGEPLSIDFAGPAGAPQGPLDMLVFKGILPGNVAEFGVAGEKALAADLSAIPTIPGASVTGWGFNIFGRYDESSKLRQLFDLGTPRVERVYNRDYQVPDGVAVDSGSKFRGDAHFFSSRDAYQGHLSVKASVKGSYGAFSGEFSAEYSSVVKRESEFQYLVFDADVATWGLSLSDPAPAKLLPSVKADPDFSSLPKTYIPPKGNDPGNGQLFFRFFRKFGTHFVGSVRMGGSLVYNAYLSKSYQYDEEEAKAKVTAEYNAVFLKTKVEAEAYWHSVGQKWTQERHVTVSGVGGTQPLIVVDPAFETNVNDKFQAWLNSVPDNPAAVGFSLKPISQLFSGDQAHAVEQAFEAYANSRVYMSSMYIYKPDAMPTPTLLVSGAPVPFTPDAQDNTFLYWAVVLDRATLQVVFNRAFVWSPKLYKSYAEYFAEIHSRLKPFNDRKHILALTTSNMWVLGVPQGDLYSLLLSCGGGRQLKQIEEWAIRQDSTNHGRIAYCLLGVMGNGPDSGVEAMASAAQGKAELLSCELYKPLLPETDSTGNTIWTPEAS
jgi:hypothetical protein